MKTRKSLKKRFKITKKGKILRRRSGQNHFLAKKSGKHKRKIRKMTKLDKSVLKRIKKILSF